MSDAETAHTGGDPCDLRSRPGSGTLLAKVRLRPLLVRLCAKRRPDHPAAACYYLVPKNLGYIIPIPPWS